MTGTFRMTTPAPSATDASDIVKRRARDDGWRVLTVRKVQPAHGGWYVELAVSREPRT